MSRIRSIHPGFFTDEDLVSVSMAARLLFLGLGVEADDKGTFEWKPITIKMRIFPGDNVEIIPLLEELVSADRVIQYESGGRKYGAIRNFARFQRPKKPNDVHPITELARSYVGLGSEINDNEGASSSEPAAHQGGVVPNQFPTGGELAENERLPFPQKSEKSPQMEDGGWRMEEGKEGSPDGDCPSGDEPALRPEHVVDEWNKLAVNLGKPRVRDLTPERRSLLKARIAQYSLEDFLAVFGKIDGSPFLRGDKDWGGCTFDWVFKKANFQKILEGNYDR